MNERRHHGEREHGHRTQGAKRSGGEVEVLAKAA